MRIKAYGPIGALCALANVKLELHGVSARAVNTGKIVTNMHGYGETRMTIYYVDGKRSSRAKALARLWAHIDDREEIILEGEMRL